MGLSVSRQAALNLTVDLQNGQFLLETVKSGSLVLTVNWFECVLFNKVTRATSLLSLGICEED